MTEIELTLTGGRDLVAQPWIWKLCRDFEIHVNIEKASVEPDFGWIALRISGAPENIQRATAWLMTTGLHVEAKQRAIGTS